MAIIDAVTWGALTGNSVTGSDLVAVSALCDAVSDAVTRLCYPILLEPRELTLQPFDAPYRGPLLLPRPVRSVSAIYVKYNANGDSSGLTAADLLAAGTDYYSPVDDVVTGWNRSGMVWRRPASNVWGYEVRYPIGQLGATVDPNKGAVFVTASVGPTTVPPAVQLAASTAVTLLFERRKTGAPLQSESWANYSASYSGSFTTTDAINSPDVRELLRAAGALPIHIA